MTTVLVLASSPTDQGPLRLGKEQKVIQNSRDSSSNRDGFRILTAPAASVDDLRRCLIEHSPDIVHFSGHGGGPHGLCFEADDGSTQAVNADSLAKLFHLVNDQVKCVVLNACYSDIQAKAISANIDFVVGMKDAIGDDAAIKFAQGFYEAIWGGHSYEKAFKFGCSAIDTANLPEERIPILLRSPRLGGSSLSYSEDTQRMENFLLQYINSEPLARSKMVIDGQVALPFIEKSRANRPPNSIKRVSVVSVNEDRLGFKLAHAVLSDGIQSAQTAYYLKPHGDSYVMDWFASTGYWPIAFRTFLAVGFRTATTVRVFASLAHYFNFDFDKEEYLSVELRHNFDGRIHGYINLRSPIGPKLLEKLYDGEEHRIAVQIFPGRDNSCVHIVKYIADSWVLTEDEIRLNQHPTMLNMNIYH